MSVCCKSYLGCSRVHIHVLLYPLVFYKSVHAIVYLALTSSSPSSAVNQTPINQFLTVLACSCQKFYTLSALVVFAVVCFVQFSTKYTIVSSNFKSFFSCVWLSRKEQIAEQREYKKKKAQKKVQRMKELEQEREDQKSKWQQFNNKAYSKNKKGQVICLLFQSLKVLHSFLLLTTYKCCSCLVFVGKKEHICISRKCKWEGGSWNLWYCRQTYDPVQWHVQIQRQTFNATMTWYTLYIITYCILAVSVLSMVFIHDRSYSCKENLKRNQLPTSVVNTLL